MKIIETIIDFLSKSSLHFDDGSRIIRWHETLRYRTGSHPQLMTEIPLSGGGRCTLIRLATLRNQQWIEPTVRALTDDEKLDLREKLIRYVKEKGERYTIDDSPLTDREFPHSAVADDPRDFRPGLIYRFFRTYSFLTNHFLMFEDKSSIAYSRKHILSYTARTSTYFSTRIPTTRDASTGAVHILLSSLENLSWRAIPKRPLTAEEKKDLRTKLIRFVGEKGKPYTIDDL
jgi:hypothetical protein